MKESIMTNARRLIVTAVLAAAAVGMTPPAIAGVQDPISIEMYCPQMAGFFPVDYAVARSLVPAEYEVVQVAPGYALLQMPIQDCISVKVDGDEIGPTPIIHFWIKVAGPEDSVEVMPGVFAQRDYFYSVVEHTDMNLLHKLVSQLGYEGNPIQSLTLGDVMPTLNGYAVRDGGVVEKVLEDGGEYGYRWHAMVVSFPTVVAPVVHTFYHTKNAGKRGEADVRCIVWVDGTGPAQLTVDPRSEAAVFGAELTGQANHLTMSCNATMWQIK
jgi:hypothetical protein